MAYTKTILTHDNTFIETNNSEGVLLIEKPSKLKDAGVFEEYYSVLSRTGKSAYLSHTIKAFKRIRAELPPSKVNCSSTVFLELELIFGEAECKNTKYGIGALSKMLKASKLPIAPYFFSLTCKNKSKDKSTTYLFACKEEDERTEWTKAIRSVTKLTVPVDKNPAHMWLRTPLSGGNPQISESLLLGDRSSNPHAYHGNNNISNSSHTNSSSSQFSSSNSGKGLGDFEMRTNPIMRIGSKSAVSAASPTRKDSSSPYKERDRDKDTSFTSNANNITSITDSESNKHLTPDSISGLNKYFEVIHRLRE
jgi:hypothetical protein